MADKPVCQQSVSWLKENFGPRHLAPLTFVHLLELYAVADSAGQFRAVAAMHQVVHAMQPHCRPFARDAIPSVLDDSSDVWSRIMEAP